jgi:hypothetical protein
MLGHELEGTVNALRMLGSYMCSDTSYIHAKLWRASGTSARDAVDLWVSFEKARRTYLFEELVI